MRNTLLCALAVSVLGVSAAAQVPPALVYQDTSFLPPRPGYETALNPMTGFGGSASSALQQIETRNHTTPGTFRLATTVQDPQGSFPGLAGGSDVLESIWDPAGLLGPAGVNNTNRAAVFNSTQAEFAFSITHDGLVGACDRLFRPQFQTRANPTVAFASPTRLVSGMPGIMAMGTAGAGFVDTALCQINGQLCWAYVDPNGDIGTSDFDPTGDPNLTNPVVRLSFALATTTAANLHSAHAMEAANGDALAFIASVNHGGGDSDTYFFPSLSNTELGGINSGLRIWDDFAWQANGGPRTDGGTLYIAHSAAAPFGYQDPLNMSIVGHNGGIMSPGSAKTIRIWVPNDGGSGPWLAGLLFGVTPTSFPLGFTQGNGLGNPRPAGVLGVIPLPSVLTLPAAGGGATVNLNIPASVPGGLGPFLITQSFGVNFANNDIFLGNTAWLGT